MALGEWGLLCSEMQDSKCVLCVCVCGGGGGGGVGGWGWLLPIKCGGGGNSLSTALRGWLS